VTVPRGLGFRSLIDELLEAEGINARISFESTDLATIEGLVGGGLGLAIQRPAPPRARYITPM
jgi:hypothetical protein